jgi:hypothetical protein
LAIGDTQPRLMIVNRQEESFDKSSMEAQLLRPGIYVVMHNRAYSVHRVCKDRTLRRFVCTDDRDVASS